MVDRKPPESTPTPSGNKQSQDQTQEAEATAQPRTAINDENPDASITETEPDEEFDFDIKDAGSGTNGFESPDKRDKAGGEADATDTGQFTDEKQFRGRESTLKVMGNKNVSRGGQSNPTPKLGAGADDIDDDPEISMTEESKGEIVDEDIIPTTK
jgi:hypothetical protein